MGHHNTMRAFTTATLTGVSPLAQRVLLGMAARAADRGNGARPADHYYGGHEWLATWALQRLVFDEAAQQAVRRAIRELERRGIVEQVTAGKGHLKAVYRLHLLEDQTSRGKS